MKPHNHFFSLFILIYCETIRTHAESQMIINVNLAVIDIHIYSFDIQNTHRKIENYIQSVHISSFRRFCMFLFICLFVFCFFFWCSVASLDFEDKQKLNYVNLSSFKKSTQRYRFHKSTQKTLNMNRIAWPRPSPKKTFRC